MNKSLSATVCLICLSALASAALPSSESYSIDQTRYFATPEIEQAERTQRIAEVSTFPAPAPRDPQALYNYLHNADQLTAQLQRHSVYLDLRASRDLDDQADADADGRVNDAQHAVREDQNGGRRARCQERSPVSCGDTSATAACRKGAAKQGMKQRQPH